MVVTINHLWNGMYCQKYVPGKTNNMFVYTYQYMVRCRHFHHYLVREITRKYLNKDSTEYGVCSF